MESRGANDAAPKANDSAPKDVRWLVFLTAALLLGLVRGWRHFDHCPSISCDFGSYYAETKHLFPPDFKIVDGWFYPPAAALFFLPFRPMPFLLAGTLWTFFNVGLLVVLIRQCAACFTSRTQKERVALGASLVLSSLPVLHSIKWGQPSLLVVVATIAALRSERGGAALIAIVSALKLYPAGYGVLWLFRGKGRRLVAAAALFLVLSLVLPVLVLGGAATRAFFENVFQQASTGADGIWAYGHTSSFWGGQGIATTLTRWFSNGEHTRAPSDGSALVVALPRAMIRALTVLVSVGALGAAFFGLRRKSLSREAEIALVLTALTMVIHPAWHHYFAFMPFAAAALLGSPKLVRTARLLVFASVATTALPLLALPWFPNAYFVYSQFGGTTVAAGLMLLAFLAAGQP